VATKPPRAASGSFAVFWRPIALALPVVAIAASCSPSSPKAAAMSGTIAESGTLGSSGKSGSGAGTTGASGAAAGTSGASGTGAGASAASASSTGANEAGTSGSTDGGFADGGADDATLGADADGAAPAPVEAGPPRCDPAHVWGLPSGLLLTPTASFARFSGVAGGELTIAWTQADGTVYVADRSATTDPFGTGQPVNVGSTALAMDRVALSSEGQTLLAVTADRTAFVGFNRSGVGLAFEPLPSSQFVNLGAMGAEGTATFSEPVLGGDGASLFFLVTPTAGAPVLVESTYDSVGRAWTGGVAFSNPELASTDSTHRRRPTGASSDGLTLFFFDEVAGLERGAWRSTTDAAFDQFVDLPDLDEAAPSTSCATLYIAPSADASASAIAFVQ
jgi:hypothetical protein